MANRQSDKYGNPAHHTGHLGAPGTTGAFETHDPLGAPGTTGASPTTGYNTSGGQEQLHHPAGHHVPLNATGTTGQGYAYGTAASMEHVGHAQVAVPHTTGLTATYDTGAHITSESDRIGGYDTGSFGGGTDIGHIGHERRHGAGYDTSVDKGRGGGYDILGKGVGGAHAGGYDTGGDKGRLTGYETLGQGVGGSETHGPGLGVGGAHGAGYSETHGPGLGVGGAHGDGYDTGGDKGRLSGYETLGQGVGGAHGSSYNTGGSETRGQGLGVGHGSGGYEAGSNWSRTQGEREHGGGYGTCGNKSHEQRVKEDSASGYDDTGGDWTHSQEVREHGSKFDIDGDKTGTGEQVHGGVSATVVEVVTEEPLEAEEGKGFIDRLMEHLPGTGAGTK